MAGEHAAVTDALERLVEAAVHEIDMDTHTGEHPRIGAVDVIPFVPLAATTIDDCVELARAFGQRIATRFELPVFLYANAATRPGAGQAGRRPARPVRGSQARDRRARPRARLRSVAPPSVGRRRGGRRTAVPDRLQHQSRLARRRACQADRPPGPRIGRRAAQGPGQRLLDRGARPGAGLDERPRLRDDARCGSSGRRSATWPPRTAWSSPSRS